MRVLVACEFSGTVRDAFTRSGHDATSCDLLPSETKGKHFQGDVREILYESWDLLIGHPPCQYLSYAAKKYWNRPGRKELREQAMEFFSMLLRAPIPMVCIENPIGEPLNHFTYSQIICPSDFGDNERKRTVLWLRGLPPLIHGMKCHPEPIYVDKSGKKRYRTDALSGSQKKERSRFFPGIAEAMANQWGNLLTGPVKKINHSPTALQAI